MSTGIFYPSDIRRLFTEYEAVAEAYFKEGAIIRGLLAKARDDLAAAMERLADVERRLTNAEDALKINQPDRLVDL